MSLAKSPLAALSYMHTHTRSCVLRIGPHLGMHRPDCYDTCLLAACPPGSAAWPYHPCILPHCKNGSTCLCFKDLCQEQLDEKSLTRSCL